MDRNPGGQTESPPEFVIPWDRGNTNIVLSRMSERLTMMSFSNRVSFVSSIDFKDSS